MLDKLRQQKQRLLDGNESENHATSPSEDSSTLSCPSLSLSYQERLFGCVTCFVLGFILSLGSTFRLAQLVHGRPAPFAVCYTVGNLLSLACTMFFVGPSTQCRTMFHAKRRHSAMLYIFFVGVTLMLCFAHTIPHRTGFVLISVILEFLALSWYTISYIPYARSAVKRTCKKMCCQEQV